MTAPTNSEQTSPLPLWVQRMPGSELERSWIAALIGMVSLGLALVLMPALNGSFVYDDISLVVDNPWVRDLNTAITVWREPLWGFTDPHLSGQVGFWRPLTVITLALGRSIGGGEAWGHHLISGLLHLAAFCAAWRLLAALLRHHTASFLIALLFAFHPLQVQAASWIAAVNDPLAGLMVLLALNSHVRWRGRGSRGTPLLTAAFLFLGLIAKEQALVGLPLLLLLDWLLLRCETDKERPRPSILRIWTPVLTCLVTWWLLRWSVFDSPSGGLGGALVGLGLDFTRSLQLRAEALGTWTFSIFWPQNLPFFHMVRPVLAFNEPEWIKAMIGLALFTGLLAWGIQRRSIWWIASILALPLAVVPVLILPENAGAFPIADRYAYLAVLPMMGIVLATLAQIVRPKHLLLAAPLLALVMGLIGNERASLYTDDETFHRKATLETPDVPAAWLGLGRVLLTKYRISVEDSLRDEAMAAFLQSLVLGHDYGDKHPKLGPEAPVSDRLQELLGVINDRQANPRPDPRIMVSAMERVDGNLGQAWCYLLTAMISPAPEFNTAISTFRAVIQAVPQSSEAHTGLGVALMAAGNLADAEPELREGTRLNPRSPQSWFNLGQCLQKVNKLNEATSAFKEAAALRPDKRTRRHLAMSLIDAGRNVEAEKVLAALNSDFPQDPQVLLVQGHLDYSKGNLTRALDWFDRALHSEPNLGPAHRMRGEVLMRQGQRAAAIDAFGRACELMPESFEAHYNGARLLLEDNATVQQARGMLEVAYRRSPPGEIRATLSNALTQFVGSDADAMMALSQLEQARGDWGGSLRWTERVLSLPDLWANHPDRLESISLVRQVRGSLFEKLKRPAEAIGEYESSLESNPASFWTLHNLGLLLGKEGRPDLAQPHLANALKNIDALGPGTDINSIRPAVQRTLEIALQEIAAHLESFEGPLTDLPKLPPKKD